jgi:hypothetical protein
LLDCLFEGVRSGARLPQQALHHRLDVLEARDAPR